jgi:hypothetical protein
MRGTEHAIRFNEHLPHDGATAMRQKDLTHQTRRGFSCFLLPGSGEQCAEVARCQLAVGQPRPIGQHEVIAK